MHPAQEYGSIPDDALALEDSDRSQPPLVNDLSPSESAGSDSLHRLVRLSCVSFSPATEKENELPSECAHASGEQEAVRIPRREQTSALC